MSVRAVSSSLKRPPEKLVTSLLYTHISDQGFGAVDRVPKNSPFRGRMRWTEALLATGFGIGGALLTAGILAALSFAVESGQIVAIAAVSIVWMSGVGVILGAWAARLRSLSVTDPLTGLFNRRFLASRLTRELKSYRQGTSYGALLFADLDRLKQLNDRFGHLAGDAAIVAVTESIISCVRAGDIVARVGGDEFNVLLPRSTPAEAEVIARRIGDALALCRGPWLEPLTLSIGVAALGADVTNEADAALYQAKEFGGGAVVIAELGAA